MRTLNDRCQPKNPGSAKNTGFCIFREALMDRERVNSKFGHLACSYGSMI